MPKPTVPSLFGDGEIAPMPEKGATEALAIYNGIAEGAGWPAARFLTTSRRAAIKRATTDYGGLQGLKTHLEAASRNDFLTGKTSRDEKHRNWKPDLDWFLKPANVLKVLEGKFPDNTSPQTVQKNETPAESEDTKWTRWLNGYRPGRFWAGGQGPRPEDPACRAPTPILKWWREQHGVVIQQPETREERLRGMISTFRRLDMYDKANQAESELAAIEGRPAILVPAPEVAGLTGAGSDRRFRQNDGPKPMRPGASPLSRADAHSAKMQHLGAAAEPPPWTEVPEGDYELEAPE